MPRDGVLRVMRDRKNRGGKVVTVVVGVPLGDVDKLGTELKRLCGTGGTTKGDSVEVQGDHRDRIAEHLKKRGYTVKLAGG
jgi:translation initiation factor 1